MAQPRVHAGHHGRVRPLLGSEHRRRTSGTAQGVVDVAHHRDLRARQRLPQALRADMGDLGQRPAGRHERPSLHVQKFRAQRGGRAAAAVVGGAAAQSQHQPLCSAGQRVGHQLAHAVGSGLFRIAARARQRQARRCGHFHHRRTVRQQAVKTHDLLAAGPCAGHLRPRAAHGGQKGVHRALAAVRHRNGADLRLRLQPQYLLRRDAADVLRGQRSFEGIRYQHIFCHGLRSFPKKRAAASAAAHGFAAYSV